MLRILTQEVYKINSSGDAKALVALILVENETVFIELFIVDSSLSVFNLIKIAVIPETKANLNVFNEKIPKYIERKRELQRIALKFQRKMNVS